MTNKCIQCMYNMHNPKGFRKKKLYSNSWNDPNELSFELLIALNVRIDGILIIRDIIRWIGWCMLYVLDVLHEILCKWMKCTQLYCENYWMEVGGME